MLVKEVLGLLVLKAIGSQLRAMNMACKCVNSNIPANIYDKQWWKILTVIYISSRQSSIKSVKEHFVLIECQYLKIAYIQYNSQYQVVIGLVKYNLECVLDILFDVAKWLKVIHFTSLSKYVIFITEPVMPTTAWQLYGTSCYIFFTKNVLYYRQNDWVIIVRRRLSTNLKQKSIQR